MILKDKKEMKINDILGKLGISELSGMQKDSYDAIMNTDKDVVVLSPTGTGKTLAYMLALIEKLDRDNSSVQALVVVPGRELAHQSDKVLKSLKTNISSASCYGGRPAMDEHRAMKQSCPQIVFGTPGRLNDHINKGNISPYAIRYIVIDEFDKCLEMGFHNEMSKLLKSLPGINRRILLSATDAKEIPEFIKISNAIRLNYINEDNSISQRVNFHKVNSPIKDKLETLNNLICSFGAQNSIVFLNHRESVERVAKYLGTQGFVVSLFHGGLEQKQREDALYKFSNGSANVLVATDLASRGIDIKDINNIIHYQLPYGKEEYIHRIGRTARWKSEGNVFFILGPDEILPDYVDDACVSYSIKEAVLKPSLPKMATLYIGKGKKDKISKGDIVGFLCKKGGIAANDIGQIDVKDRYTYVAISRNKVDDVLYAVNGEKIKGIKTIVEFIK